MSQISLTLHIEVQEEGFLFEVHWKKSQGMLIGTRVQVAKNNYSNCFLFDCYIK